MDIIQNKSLFFCEYKRQIKCLSNIIFPLCFYSLIIGVFSFILQNYLVKYLEIGHSCFWISQGFCTFLYSYHLFKKDMNQGFFLNLLNSSSSLIYFLFVRWSLFTFFVILGLIGISPLLFYALHIPFSNWKYIIALIFPFNGMILGYTGLLSLFLKEEQNYFLIFLILPFSIPFFILSILGSQSDFFTFSFSIMVGLILLIMPIILMIINKTLFHLIDYF